VVITGTNLARPTAVKFGTASAAITGQHATSVTATSPAGKRRRRRRDGDTANGTSATSANDKLPTWPPDRHLDRPASGRPAGGTSVVGERYELGLGHVGQVRHRLGGRHANTAPRSP